MSANVRAYATSRLADRSRTDGMLYTRCYAMSRAAQRDDGANSATDARTLREIREPSERFRVTTLKPTFLKIC